MSKLRPKSAPGAPKKRSAKVVRPYRKRATWAMLHPEELARPGASLLALILDKANTQGLGPRELAQDALGVSYGYFAALRSGDKEIPKIGDDLVARMAEFLGLPKVAVLLAAGQLKLEDFYHDTEAVHDHMQPALQFIQRDPEIGAYLPVSAFVADPALQLFLIMLYEKASGRTLIPGKTSAEEIVERYRNLVSGAAIANKTR